ncbi:MAG: amidohydrolase family protein, partial [Acidimicrobiales bacterium]
RTKVLTMKSIVIKNGTVIDGSGSPGFLADVLVEEGRISAIGANLQGDTELEASGCVVAPGFIDIHTHYDAQVFWDSGLTPSSFHGVTTVIAGNCGFSIAPTRPEHRELIARTLENVEDMDVAALRAGVPWNFTTFPEYLDAVRNLPLGLNFTAYIGHTALRLFVMGDAAYERTATDEEIARMVEVLTDALNSGAAGFATSVAPTHRGVDGKPIPSRFADRKELEALFSCVGEVGKGVVEVTPGEILPLADIYDLQLESGAPFTITALLSTPSMSHRNFVELNRSGWQRGARVWPQVSPRPLSFAMSLAEPFTFNVNSVFAELLSGTLAEREVAYADRDWRDRARDVWSTGTFMVPRWETFEISECPSAPTLEGMRIADLAAAQHCDPFDFLLDLALEQEGLMLRVRCIVANDDPDEVALLITEEHCALGLSDAGAHVGQLCDAPQATDLLGNWVRDRGVMTLEQAVYRLTKSQADLFKLIDRGEIRIGAWADIVVFDPRTVAPGPVRRIADFPAGSERLTADQPSGVRHVLVNGTPIRLNEQQMPLGAGPGVIAQIGSQ